uniref:HTH psq-type domain-containing protein n=1 Tax=Timema shepardi TaxID=629360 RepID=A0A7R9G421_TIMSH|nr:unnamed protein product [Timema shepardi]
MGIPSSTLYKIARREGIRLAAPFNAAPTTWTQDDLERALEAIRSGQTSVQRASTEFGIPTGTLYGRCKREGIELSRSNPTPWSEDAMGEALEAVRVGQMSINQAAIHYNLPYSSLYGRFKRGKYEAEGHQHPDETGHHSPPTSAPQCFDSFFLLVFRFNGKSGSAIFERRSGVNMLLVSLSQTALERVRSELAPRLSVTDSVVTSPE